MVSLAQAQVQISAGIDVISMAMAAPNMLDNKALNAISEGQGGQPGNPRPTLPKEPGKTPPPLGNQ